MGTRRWAGAALLAFLTAAVAMRFPAMPAAGGESAVEPSRPQGFGQLLVQDAQSGSAVRLNISRHHVHVVLQPPVALVQIDQSFYNPLGSQQGACLSSTCRRERRSAGLRCTSRGPS